MFRNAQNPYSRISQWLLSEYHVTVPAEWLSECIEWIRNSSGGVNDCELQAAVYQQWLVANLNELQHPCLPENLAQTKETVIEGFFPLQMNSLIDISRPPYQQYAKASEKDLSNALVSAETTHEESKKNWEPKSNRLLKMELTDGVQVISGMEHKVIPDLNVNLPPGCKILVHGVIRCHLGVLLLQSHNVRLLGGEVEELAQTNNQLTLLRNMVEKAKNGEFDQNRPLPKWSGCPSGGDAVRNQNDTTRRICEIPKKDNIRRRDETTHISNNKNPASSEVPCDLDDSFWEDFDIEDRQQQQQQAMKSSSDLLGVNGGAWTNQHQSDENMWSDDDIFMNCEIEFADCASKDPAVKSSSTNNGENRLKTALSRKQPFNSGKNRCENSPKRHTISDHFAMTNESLEAQPEPKKMRCERSLQPIRSANEIVSDCNFDADDQLFYDIPDSMISQSIRASSPYEYLINLIPPVTKMRVKAFVMSIESKLLNKENSDFFLKVLINDGSASRSVVLANQVLEQVTGITAGKFVKLKQDAKGDIACKKRKANILAQLQQKLINMSSLMDIKVQPDSSLEVVKITEVDKETVESLKIRARNGNS